MSCAASALVWLLLACILIPHVHSAATEEKEYYEISEFEYDTLDTITWVTTDDKLTDPATGAITFSYEGYLVMFGGSLRQVYLGTVADNETINWRITGSLENEFEIWCDHQCHTVDLPNLYFMVDHFECSDGVYLNEMHLPELVNGNVSIDRFNLTEFYYNETRYSYDCFNDESMINPCVTADANHFKTTQTVFVVMGTRILVYNVSERTGYFSNGSFTVRSSCKDADNNEETVCEYEDVQHVLSHPACTVDVDGNVWVADGSEEFLSRTPLWRYSVDDDELIDVSSYYVYDGPDEQADECPISKDSRTKSVLGSACQYSNGTEIEKPHFFAFVGHLGLPKMTNLNDGYILFTSQGRDYLLLPNTSTSDADTRTPFIDIVCAGRTHDGADSSSWKRNMPIKRGSGDVVWSLGGGDNGAINISTQVRTYNWKEDFNLVINWTESVRFGDNLELQVYIEPGCPDLRFYDDGYNASALNPFVLEVQMQSAEEEIDIYGFIYIINATASPNGDGSAETYELCYLCETQIEDISDAMDYNEEEMLESDCGFCSDGLSLTGISEEEAGEPYKIEFQILNNVHAASFTLASLTRTVIVTECDPGFGTNEGASVLDCNVCPFNQFSFVSSLDPCISCEGVSQENLLCSGGNQTELAYNFWIAAYDLKDKEFKPFFHIEQYYNESHKDDDKIVTVLCPPNYCCQRVGGCDYYSNYLRLPQENDWNHNDDNGYGETVQLENGTWVEQWIEYDEYDYYDYDGPEYNWNTIDVGALCAIGRDVHVPLCGKCLEGWAEILGSAQCADCREDGAGWVPIAILSFLLTMIASHYIIFIDSKPLDYSSTLGTKALMMQDDINGFQTILFKPVLYYFQTLNLILDTRGIELWLSPVLDFFNLSFDTVGGEDSKICWSENLDATGEILVNVLVPVFLMIHLILPLCCIDKRGNASCCCICLKQKKICCCCCRNSRTPYFASAFFRVLLITIGVMLTVCFKYVTYVVIEDQKLLFYSADKEAFGGWWFGGFFGIIMILVVFGIIFYQIKKQEPDSRYSSNSIYRKFVKSFKTDFWYWEFVLFSRRFLMALFLAAQFVGGDYTNFIFVIILVVYFGLQIHLKPFAHTRVNRVETLCMLLLIAAFVSANFVRIDDDDVFVSTILSICILVPLIIIALYLMKIVYHRVQIRYYDETKDQHREEKMDKMMNRMPKSFRNVVSAGTQSGATALETNIALSGDKEHDEPQIAAQNQDPILEMVEQQDIELVETVDTEEPETEIQDDAAVSTVENEEGNPTLS